MYKCKNCGNVRLFTEYNTVKTYLVVDDETGEVLNTEDKFLSCAEVVCACCGASSEDECIVDRYTDEPITVE